MNRSSKDFGIAAFVKTPGVSALKTRLASGLGGDAALEFYELACAAIRNQLIASRSDPRAEAYWAVAEEEIDARWRDLGVLLQGEGGLGARLDKIHRELLARHRAFALIGADCPQLASQTILAACARAMEIDGFVVGPARDGGFYLLAGAREVPRSIWEEVPYSVETTAAELTVRLEALGPVEWLLPLTDVDHAEDLPKLLEEIPGDASPELERLARWILKVIGRR